MRRAGCWLLLVTLTLSGCAEAVRSNVHAYPQLGQTAERQSWDQA
jgi:hypothetical protein